MGMRGGDPVATIRQFISIGNASLIEPLLKDIDLLKFGGDLLQIACAEGKRDIVDLFISRGVDLATPPEKVSGDDDYRRTPYVISAAKSGDLDTLEGLLKSGCSISDGGPICISKKKKNVVVSNVIGCAAYHGKRKMLEMCISRLGQQYIDIEAIEHIDQYGKKSGTSLQKEFSKYTPLMLAVAGSDKNLECVKTLLNHRADSKAKDCFDNTVLHIAALNGNNQILDYLSKNLSNIFDRNSEGETALNVCQKLKNQDGINILSQFQEQFDDSKATADSILEELNAKESQEEEARAKKRQKKWRNKINRIAKAENLLPVEVEKRLLEEEENRKEEERLEQKRIEEQEKQ